MNSSCPDSHNSEETVKKLTLWVPKSLNVVLEAINKNISVSGPIPINAGLENLLKTLDYSERYCTAKYFCQLPWNVSSVKVLGILNRLCIVSAAEFILSQTDHEHIQLVLNDFLETEFELLSSLIISGHFDLLLGSKISEYVSESIRRLFADLAIDPKLNSLDYLPALRLNVPKDILANFVTNHLRNILSMHQRSTKIAFESFYDWVKQSLEDHVLLTNFYKKAVIDNEVDIVKTLFNISTMENFLGWRNYMLLLGMIAKDGDIQCLSFIKKFLKERLKLVAQNSSKETMAHLLLSIRTVLFFQEDKTETYAKWYKQYIGDMKFVFDATEFKTIIAVLTDLVPYETDEVYLEVHVKTSISPPVMCSQICRDYKVLCQTRISDIADCSRIMDLDDDIMFCDIAE